MIDFIDVRIFYEDTDCGGVVYYAKYLNYLERARTMFLEGRSISLTSLMNDGTFFIVVHASIDYKSPGRYGDILRIFSEIERVSAAAIAFKHKIVRLDTGLEIASANVKLACVDGDMKIRRIRDVLPELYRHFLH